MLYFLELSCMHNQKSRYMKKVVGYVHKEISKTKITEWLKVFHIKTHKSAKF